MFCEFLRLLTKNRTRATATTTMTEAAAILAMALVDKELLVEVELPEPDVSEAEVDDEVDDEVGELEDDEPSLIATELSLLFVFVCPPEVEDA